MQGATIPPILAKNDPTPKPMFRTTVGNCSAVYTYTAPYEAVMANLAIIAQKISNHALAVTFNLRKLVNTLLLFINQPIIKKYIYYSIYI